MVVRVEPSGDWKGNNGFQNLGPSPLEVALKKGLKVVAVHPETEIVPHTALEPDNVVVKVTQ